MNAGDSDLDKLCKVLALTNSDEPGEALAAFQAAKGMLLRNGLSFEDIIAAFFDDAGATPQQQIAAMRKRQTALQRELDAKAREIKQHKKAIDDLVQQVRELSEGQAATPPPNEPVVETIRETYRPNLTG